MERFIVFDVNETLLDLGPIRRGFAEAFGDEAVAATWFGTLLKLSFVSAIVDEYHPFTDLARAAFDMVRAAEGATVADEVRDDILGRIRTLPPHPDVLPAIERMAGAGIPMAALTNSPPATAKAQLTNAGIAPYLAEILTVDMVRRFKPAPEVYRTAAARLAIPIDHMVMVAAHDWDVAGAMHAGAAGAFVARPGQVLSPLQPEPAFVVADLGQLADALGA